MTKGVTVLAISATRWTAHDLKDEAFMSTITKALVTIFARDITRLVQFYRTVLGLRETYRFPKAGTPMHVEFYAGGTTLAVSSDAGLKSHGMTASTAGSHSFELGLKVENTDAMIADLRNAGVAILREPFDSEAGNRVAYATDPHGNWISMYHNGNRDSLCCPPPDVE